MKIVTAVAALILSSSVMAQSGGPPEGSFKDVPNVGRVWIYECLGDIAYHGWGLCIRVEPKAWGQLCDHGGASFAAGTWYEQNKPISYIFRAAWWQCQSQMDPKTAPWPMSGPL